MVVCRWRLLRAGPSTLTQHKVRFSLIFSPWVMTKFATHRQHPYPPPDDNMSDKKLWHSATTPLPFLQTVFMHYSSSASRRQLYTPPVRASGTSAYLQISSRGSDWWWANSLPSTISLLLIRHSFLETVWLSLGSLCPVPHPRLWSTSSGRPDSLGFIPMHALAPPLLRLTNKEAN